MRNYTWTYNESLRLVESLASLPRAPRTPETQKARAHIMARTLIAKGEALRFDADSLRIAYVATHNSFDVFPKISDIIKALPKRKPTPFKLDLPSRAEKVKCRVLIKNTDLSFLE